MRPQQLRNDLARIGAAASLCALLAVLVFAVASAGATDADKLEAKLASARDEASSLSVQLQSTTAELGSAEAEAKDAAAEEEELTDLLTKAKERTAELARKLEATEKRLALEKARLRRSRQVLAQRLVAIYEQGTPSTADLVFGSGDYEDFVTQSDYLRAISEADSALADRVAEVREAVHQQVLEVADLKAEAVAYDERLEAAREEIGAVREAAEAAAARLQSLSASREASLATLKSDISEWVDQIQEARLAESEAEAEEEVGRWLGGPYSIPTYIVMCESGGNYSALNPSSGAGGAYQILPSTWELYGGKGLPHEAPKAEQDRIAAEIWADSGPSAWVCA
ncbi:MAG TPA: transglycosylase family protein [Solirubrobacterales bacterium]|nr:transglycosylase family protein [Solirubrobacterales bacterium]